MAKTMAKWGNKSFLVNTSKIVPILDIKTGFARKSDTGDDTSGTPTTNTRGMELQTITLETRYVAGVGVDPREQVDDWKKQFDQHHTLYIGGKQFGPKFLELDSVDFSNILLDNAGRFLQVDVSIVLTEYVPPTTKKSEKNKSSGSSSTKSGAMSASASTTDKQSKKTTKKR